MLETFIDITVTSRDKAIDKKIEDAWELIRAYELKFSYHNLHSVLYQINSTESPHEIDNDFYEILNLAKTIYHKSNHMYDISIGRLIDVWDFENAIIPDSLDITEAKNYIGFENITFDTEYLYMPYKYKLNLGSIAKGYIIDRVIEYFIDLDVIEVTVNAGGDIRFYSEKNRKWTIGIKHPRIDDVTIGTIRISNMAVATSGDYERFFISEGRRYHHLLDPFTGYPSEQTISVTVLAPTAIMADAISTAAAVMNPADAINMIKSFENVEAIIYFKDEYEDIKSVRTEKMQNWFTSQMIELR
jgi:thiamine biosynthesis lipoprotein